MGGGVQTVVLDGSLDERLTRIFASDPAAMAHPDATWRDLRECAPVHRLGPIVLIARHRDARDVLRDDRRFSSRYFATGSRVAAISASLTPEQRRANDEIAAFESQYMSRSDDDQHERLRGSANRVFTPRRIAQTRATIAAYTDEMLGVMREEDETDIVARLAYRLPLMVIADMLGVPAEDRDRIHQWSSELGRNRGGDDPEALMIAHRAMREFRHYVEEILVPLRSRRSGSDLLTALLDAEDENRLSPVELTAMFVVLLFAGHETTTNLISIGLLELLRHRDQWERVCADPALAPAAVEELLRWVSPVQFQWRATRADVVVGGTEIEAGTTVAAVLAAANRDPEVFADANRLDVSRADARRHLALGLGPHFCLGNALARLEAAVALEALASRFPELELVDAEPPFRGNAMLRTPGELRVSLGRERRAD